MQKEILEDGQGSDEYPHRSLVRQDIRRRVTDRELAHQLLKGWTKDGKWVPGWNERHPQSILERDVRAQWKLGNRGENGDWK